jgi:hypothetical protein
MGEATALKLAIDLLHVPSRVRSMRSAALPADVPTLLEIAAGNAEAASRASEATGRSQDIIRNAAAFFIEQILLAPDADSYRVLGGNAQTGSSDLRRNMALLLRWLHPDMGHNGSGDRSIFANRITLAWEDLKTAERRAAYDAQQQGRRSKTSPGRGRGKGSGRHRTAGTHAQSRPYVVGRHERVEPPLGRLWRALLMLFGAPRH